MNMAVSQNSQNSTISMTLPNIVFNVSRFYPFKRREAQGKARWYEKISMQYTGKMTNTVSTTESEVFTKQTLENMRNGIEHSIPVTASFNLFNYINVSPSFNYTEKWYFKKQEREWSPVTNEVRYLDPEYGFYRLYNYTTSVSASTTLYGMYQFKKRPARYRRSGTRSPRRSAFRTPPTSRIRNTATTKPYRPTPPASSKSIRPSPTMPTAFPVRAAACR